MVTCLALMARTQTGEVQRHIAGMFLVDGGAGTTKDPPLLGSGKSKFFLATRGKKSTLRNGRRQAEFSSGEQMGWLGRGHLRPHIMPFGLKQALLMQLRTIR